MTRERIGRRIAQVALAGAAILLLLWLANVVYQYDDAVWQGLADIMSRSAWIAVLLILLVIILVVEILLLDPVYERVMPRRDAVPTPHDTLYMVGCGGCGTVFDRREHEIDEPHEKRFACPNCGRTGELKDMELHDAHVDEVTCHACGEVFRQYKAEAECPHCGAVHNDPDAGLLEGDGPADDDGEIPPWPEADDDADGDDAAPDTTFAPWPGQEDDDAAREAEADVLPLEDEADAVDEDADESRHVIDIEGIGDKYAARLNRDGVITIRDLLHADTDRVAETARVNRPLAEEWQAMAALMQLRGVGPQYAEVLVRADVRSVEALAEADPEAVCATIDEVAAGRKVRIQGADIKPGMVRRWVDAARDHLGTA